MKKGVWNVENPLALSELFSDGIFLLPVSGDVGAVDSELISAVSEPTLVAANIPNTESLNTAPLNTSNTNPESAVIPSTESLNSAPLNTSNTNPESAVIPNTESSNSAPPVPEKSEPTSTLKLPKWEGVAIVNLINEENQFEPMDVIKKTMQALKIPGVEINGQTVKFITISKGSTSLTPEMLEKYAQHFTQVRIIFWIKNSSLESSFQKLNHPRILMVDMPSIMVSSDDKKRNNWSTIKAFFGM
jgi:hypothetical protein